MKSENFENCTTVVRATYKRGASHIYVGDRRFINAIGSKGVSYDSLDNPYFAKRFLGAKRIIPN
ncbi:NlpC/P60 family protein [Merismopedia glauca]|uniref:NlpC/P60 family protein n=1 Tax=Merismopedia glauca TaxID=292586 RepID=UPI0034E09111